MPGCITFCKGNCVLPPRLHADRITRLRLAVGLHRLLDRDQNTPDNLLHVLEHVSEYCTNLKILHMDFPSPKLSTQDTGGELLGLNNEQRGYWADPEVELGGRVLFVLWRLIDWLDYLQLLMNARCEEVFEPWLNSLAFPHQWTRTLLEESGSYEEGGEPMDLRYELDCQQGDVDVVRFVTFPGGNDGA